MSDLVGNPEGWFSQNEAHIFLAEELILTTFAHVLASAAVEKFPVKTGHMVQELSKTCIFLYHFIIIVFSVKNTFTHVC